MVDDIADVGQEEFDALDRTAGAAGCHGRLAQRQADGRWQVSYLRARLDGRLTAMIPVYACRSRTWPDPAYDAGTWDLPTAPREGRDAAYDAGTLDLPMESRESRDPGHCLLVGGCADVRSALHAGLPESGPDTARLLLARLAGHAAAQDKCLVFPYMDTATKAALAEAGDGGIAWTVLRREARLSGVLNPEWERELGSRVHGVLRRDQRLIEAAALHRSQPAWADIADEAGELIAEHYVRKGEPDHPEFVRLRHAEWDQCDGVELVVFATAVDDVRGVLTALVWEDELELRDIGLTVSDSPHRLAAYLDLLFHRPLEFARARGLRTIRAGHGAEVPKRSRGAVFQDLYGGVLDRAGCERLARARS
ncbi:MAG: hypothetical protein ACRDP6_08150 [Actinoallomurus sp.]